MSEEVLPNSAGSKTLPTVLAWIGLAIVTAIGLVGAWLCNLLGTMHGFDAVGTRRLEQWPSVIGFHAGAGLFVAFPIYLAGIWKGSRRLLFLSLAVLLAVAAALAAIWLL